MQGRTMYINCRRQGFKLTEEEAQEYCDIWANTFPEMQKYFDVKQDGWADDIEEVETDTEEEGEESLIDCSAAPTQARRLYKNSNLLGMWRVRCSRNAALNFPFQSLAAVISKRALWLTYLDSLRLGYKLVCFIHEHIVDR